MDTELFQSLALVLLAVIAILLGAVAALVARVRKAIEQAPWSELGTSLESQPAAYPQESAVRVEGASSAATAEPAASTASPAATVSSGMRPLEQAQSSASTEPEPRSMAASDATPIFDAEERAARESAAQDEPQEQPFERDGRWWFRRGDELLVYDEQTGQWLPAPAPTVAASVAHDAPASGGTSSVATETRTSSLQDLRTDADLSGQTSGEPSSGFWKCPSCGAVNGSTATSCRMCFSARPS
jgi:hypothetical protein